MKSSISHSSLYRRVDGAALIEFALFLPLLLLLVLGGAELTRYILISQKVDKAVNSLANISTQMYPADTCPAQTDNLSVERLREIFGSNQSVMDDLLNPYEGRPKNVFTNVSWRMSSITRPVGSDPEYDWSFGCRDTYASDLCFRNDAQPVPIPPSFTAATMYDNENAIIVRMDYRTPALFQRWWGSTNPLYELRISRTAIFTPRLGHLALLPEKSATYPCAIPGPPTLPGPTVPTNPCRVAAPGPGNPC